MKVRCPTCRKVSEYSPHNPFRPFCCERCQTLDLGAWADERYRVPVHDQDPTAVNENPEPPREGANSPPPKHHLN